MSQGLSYVDFYILRACLAETKKKIDEKKKVFTLMMCGDSESKT